MGELDRIYVGEDVFDASALDELGLDILGADDDDDDVDLDDLLSGGEGLEILGAKAKKQSALVKMIRQAKLMAKIRAGGGVAVRNTAPKNKRIVWLPIGPTAAIASGGVWTVTLIPTMPVRLERPAIPAVLAGSFDIATYNIGNEPQLAGGGTLPLDLWVENAVKTNGLGKSVNAGVPIVMSGTNINAVGAPAVILRGGIVCTALV